MKKYIVIGVLLAALAVSGCQAAGEDPRIVELQDRVADLEGEIAGLVASSAGVGEGSGASHDQAFQVVLGTYLLDNAGLHGIDEGLQAAEEIDPSYLGVIRRIRGVVAATPWPEELQAQAAGLVDQMDALAAALEADDLEAARTGAADVHSTQHDFSHAVEGWLVEHGITPGGEHHDG